MKRSACFKTSSGHWKNTSIMLAFAWMRYDCEWHAKHWSKKISLDILIRRVRVRDDGPVLDIGIERGVFVRLEERIDEPSRQLIEAGGRAAIPGLLEPHIHLDKALLEGRMPNRSGTLEEAIRITGILKRTQDRTDMLARSRQVLDMAVRNGTVGLRCHPDVDPIQGLIGVETLLELKAEYANLLDLQIVA